MQAPRAVFFFFIAQYRAFLWGRKEGWGGSHHRLVPVPGREAAHWLQREHSSGATGPPLELTCSVNHCHAVIPGREAQLSGSNGCSDELGSSPAPTPAGGQTPAPGKSSKNARFPMDEVPTTCLQVPQGLLLFW